MRVYVPRLAGLAPRGGVFDIRVAEEGPELIPLRKLHRGLAILV